MTAVLISCPGLLIDLLKPNEIYIYTYIYTHIYTYIYIYIHTHIYVVPQR